MGTCTRTARTARAALSRAFRKEDSASPPEQYPTPEPHHPATPPLGPTPPPPPPPLPPPPSTLPPPPSASQPAAPQHQPKPLEPHLSPASPTPPPTHRTRPSPCTPRGDPCPGPHPGWHPRPVLAFSGSQVPRPGLLVRAEGRGGSGAALLCTKHNQHSDRMCGLTFAPLLLAPRAPTNRSMLREPHPL